MNVLDFPAEVAESCLEIAIALSQVAKDDGDLLATASYVHRCYVRALEPHLTARTHHARWRRFITALDVYLEHCTPSPQAARLRTIVSENADLLEPQAALAS
jgi:hypothetical protein